MNLVEGFASEFAAASPGEACELAVREYAPHARNDLGVESLATTLGLKVARVRNPSFDGRIVWDDPAGPRIEIADGRPANRTRFTVAHEVGHWIVRQVMGEVLGQRTRHRSTERLDDGLRAEEEVLANAIAAEMVVPAQCIREASRYAVNPTMVKAMARTRRASTQTVLRRFAEVLRVHASVFRAMPMYFDRLSSPAEIDTAVVFKPDGTRTGDRNNVRFVSEIPFCLLRRAVADGLQLTIQGSHVTVRGESTDVPGPDPCCEVMCLELVK